ncbi:MAG: hypothetical protein JOZ95_12575 [Solirubrobacterales bacterium]|nr:hypothetical protein [Solirubrobacterales bacterium]
MTEPQPLAGAEPTSADADMPVPDPTPSHAGADGPTPDAVADPLSPDAGADPLSPDAGADPLSPDAGADPPTPRAEAAAEPGVEIVDGVAVLAEVRTVERASPSPLPAVQVAAVAATSFAAGAATVVLVKRMSGRKLARRARRGPRRAADMLPIAASRSFLVDVHVIAKPELPGPRR